MATHGVGVPSLHDGRDPGLDVADGKRAAASAINHGAARHRSSYGFWRLQSVLSRRAGRKKWHCVLVYGRRTRTGLPYDVLGGRRASLSGPETGVGGLNSGYIPISRVVSL